MMIVVIDRAMLRATPGRRTRTRARSPDVRHDLARKQRFQMRFATWLSQACQDNVRYPGTLELGDPADVGPPPALVLLIAPAQANQAQAPPKARDVG